MPVIKKPHNQPLLGGKTYVILGALDKNAMREWQRRIRAAKNKDPEPGEGSRNRSD